jgi:hypothetical protein
MREKYFVETFEGEQLGGILAESHTQNDPYSTFLNRLSRNGKERIRKLKSIYGYLYTTVGGRRVKINN